ncbi:MAG: hypothetical protein IK148_11160 [Prevotella sp.]|nr:hypothetical protein [Prevotella sp.]
MRVISLAKFEEGITNEDAAISNKELIAVSDGAGGGGVYADCWSKYLVNNLPDKSIRNYKAFDKWIDGIWEAFYNEYEEKAKAEGGMLLNKFYDEGSFATLVAVWNDGQWISYGDSVAFCYNKKTGILHHSFTKLADFNNPPYLINCKDPLDEKGFRKGKFEIDNDSIVFAASDTLAHYILMMYEIDHQDQYAEELQEAIDAQTKNSNFIKAAMRLRKRDFAKDVIRKLENCRYEKQLMLHIGRLKRWGFIGHDDYSIALL